MWTRARKPSKSVRAPCVQHRLGCQKNTSRQVHPTNCISTDTSRSDASDPDDKKRLHPIWRCRKPPNRFRGVVGIPERYMDARRKQRAHADYLTRDNVAIATVCGGDGLRYCTLTLCGVARRSVLRQPEPRHGDVSFSCAPARAQDTRRCMQ